MRKRNLIYSWIIILGSCLLFANCQDDVLPGESVIGAEVDAVLNFGATNQEKIDISTRSTLDLHYESMIRNLYAFVFANNEQKVYGHYFDNTNLNQNSEKQYWTVNNMPSGSTNRQTSGTLHMKVPSISNAEIVLIANLDLDLLNISPERLALVSNKQDLTDLVVSLNQDIPNRNAGYFLMTGQANKVTINSNGTINVPNGKITLQRLDAKVEVNVKVTLNDVQGGKKITQFTPESWEVRNLPKSSYLMPNAEVLALSKDNYFHIEPKNFETTQTNTHGNRSEVQYGFSFYALENKRSADKKGSVNGDFHSRELRNKNDEGQYDNTKGMWEYAPELATYVIIKGELQVETQGNNTNEYKVADVTYYVHLGDFANDKDNYDILRNTHYTYTISINGINSIEVEVKTSNDNDPDSVTENQPGAMGNIYESENIHTLDAHYGQFVFTIRASEIEAENLTWYVRTPFGSEGVPENGVYNDLDYKWVEFMLNDKEGNVYSNANKPYPKDKANLMTVIDMLNLVKEEHRAWKRGDDSQFDSNGDMKFTVFVDEFFYEKNPMKPNDTDVLWKKFVNQPPRLMHILQENLKSVDGESSVTKGNLLTILQNSIQTPYNINLAKTDLKTAWGCETVDELKGQAWFYSPEERFMTYDIGWVNTTYSYVPSGYKAHNTSLTDGLYNTAELLNLLNGNLEWDDFLDYTTEEPQLKPEYKASLYSVFLRNRDLNGDGYVQANELRWYIASLDQLFGLFLGDQGLSGDAQLYPLEIRANGVNPISKPGDPFDGVYPWRVHVVSSTAWLSSSWMSEAAGNLPTVIWAEEGISTGQYQQNWNKYAYSQIRCVRNLGMEDATESTIASPGVNYPVDPLVKVIPPTASWVTSDDVYKFDLTNINEGSRRYYSTREFPAGDELSFMNRVYDGFETGVCKNVGVNYHQTGGLKTILENGGSPSGTPAGYRVPNLREGAIMHLYCAGSWWPYLDGDYQGTMVSNYCSLGLFGNRYDNNVYSWIVFGGNITMDAKDKYRYVRFVKDWNPN
ncbi:MAG: DUF4906 domain-containing protein [Bacteroides sp.]|nr:DUF4906 domain-containing protein [Bacteroides sp.]